MSREQLFDFKMLFLHRSSLFTFHSLTGSNSYKELLVLSFLEVWLTFLLPSYHCFVSNKRQEWNECLMNIHDSIAGMGGKKSREERKRWTKNRKEWDMNAWLLFSSLVSCHLFFSFHSLTILFLLCCLKLPDVWKESTMKKSMNGWMHHKSMRVFFISLFLFYLSLLSLGLFWSLQ